MPEGPTEIRRLLKDAVTEASHGSMRSWREIANRFLRIRDDGELIWRVWSEAPSGRALDAGGGPLALDSAHHLALRAIERGEATAFVVSQGGRTLSIGGVSVELLTIGGLRILDRYFCLDVLTLEPVVARGRRYLGVFADPDSTRSPRLVVFDAHRLAFAWLETWPLSPRPPANEILEHAKMTAEGISFVAVDGVSQKRFGWEDVHWRPLATTWRGPRAELTYTG